MTKKIAVLISHGMGVQSKPKAGNPQQVGHDDHGLASFSSRLLANVRDIYGPKAFGDDVAWAEVFWADIYQTRQDAYMRGAQSLSGRLGWVRRFIKNKISDAASYQFSKSPTSSYQKIHARFDDALRHLQAQVGPDVPVVILAHSLGAHVTSNYIWDATHGNRTREAGPAPFEGLSRIKGILSFGANIPVFSYAYEEIKPIACPSKIGVTHPWWINYFYNTDSLAFPIAPLGDGYREMANAGAFLDHRVSTWLPFPFSHNAYFWRKDFAREVSDFIKSQQVDAPKTQKAGAQTPALSSVLE